MNADQLQDAMMEAQAALDRAEFLEALESLEAITREHPDFPDALLKLGVCYLETGHLPQAVKALEQSVAVEPENAQAHYLLGSAVGSSGDIDRAAACYRRALELDPSHQKAEEFLVRAMSLMESRQHFRDALRLLKEKQPPASYAALALKELLQSIAIFPESPAREELTFCVRELMRQLRDVAFEIEIPESLGRWVMLCQQGHQALKFLNFAQAVQPYEEALMYREEPCLFHNFALALFQTGRVDDAIKIWLRLLGREPDFDFTTLGKIIAVPATGSPGAGQLM